MSHPTLKTEPGTLLICVEAVGSAKLGQRYRFAHAELNWARQLMVDVTNEDGTGAHELRGFYDHRFDILEDWDDVPRPRAARR